MTRRSRRLRAWPVDQLQELERLPAQRRSTDVCLRCGHIRGDHHRGYRQCRLHPDECHWFRYDETTGKRLKLVGTLPSPPTDQA